MINRLLLIIFLMVSIFVLAKEEKDLRARLVIVSDPSPAAVYINNVFVGNTPLDIEISPGQHRIRIAIDENYVPEYITLVAFAKNKYEYKVNMNLTSQGAYRAAEHYHKLGDLQKARDYYILSTTSFGKTIPEAYFYAGYIDFLFKNFEKAEENLLSYISYNSKSASTWYVLGETRNTLGKKNLAIACYKECLKVLYPKTQNLLNSVKVSSEELEKLKKEIINYPTLDNYIRLARIYEQKGDLENSIYYYRKAIFLFDLNLNEPYQKRG
ncbi:MAG: PEGA domain-containing protein [Candidatus Calescibacterium sp.]|nr:PEGA domain-containing protein [Candidatus Calescibacterium sp.]MCX7972179.1 PEGA domain-containing protein [bacterium]MDW8194869.1 PEGA domain-containing protein [Candidatus Calescibacterium sp.]